MGQSLALVVTFFGVTSSSLCAIILEEIPLHTGSPDFHSASHYSQESRTLTKREPSANVVIGVSLGGVIGGTLLVCLALLTYCKRRQHRMDMGISAFTASTPSTPSKNPMNRFFGAVTERTLISTMVSTEQDRTLVDNHAMEPEQLPGMPRKEVLAIVKEEVNSKGMTTVAANTQPLQPNPAGPSRNMGMISPETSPPPPVPSHSKILPSPPITPDSPIDVARKYREMGQPQPTPLDILTGNGNATPRVLPKRKDPSVPSDESVSSFDLSSFKGKGRQYRPLPVPGGRPLPNPSSPLS